LAPQKARLVELWQVMPVQQPEPQVAVQLVHAWLTQLPVQELQIAPALPHAVFLSPVLHLPWEQQPVQEEGSQTQDPPTQCSPAAQAALVPHRHWPAESQLSAIEGSQAAHSAPG
jgi:hypothetical protein